eukprot:CAMPEP_0178396416 /NCGR_PEP_ID=MMETSP0689_2-20121128/13717_1 /TAXON_ID=160604 /ORGANISM="Amphidinium massartii, Strain CS-259" /LENGTH=552 /DNA_ID=CAMNT_0020017089 /DNA_START=86 /DNA_END=1740 /DNA_ORIENTATION=+
MLQFSEYSINFGPEVKKLGFDVYWDGERPSITTVKPGSEAESRGILSGDVLAKVNGQGTTGRKKDELMPILKGRPLDLLLERQVAPDVEDEGSSSDEEVPAQQSGRLASPAQRQEADLALLASLRAGRASPGSSAGSPPSRRTLPARAKARVVRENAGEDSAEEDAATATGHAVAARYNADMGLLHKKNQRLVEASYATAKAPEAKGKEDVAADAEIARKLQDQLDAEQKELERAAAAKAAETQKTDEALARELQGLMDEAAKPGQQEPNAADSAKADNAAAPAGDATASDGVQLDMPKASEEEAAEAKAAGGADEEAEPKQEIDPSAPFTLQITVPDDAAPGAVLTVLAPSGQLVQATVPPECGPGDPLLIHVDPNAGDDEQEAVPSPRQQEDKAAEADSKTKETEPQAGANKVPNLLDIQMAPLCTVDNWESRVRRLSTTGLSCSKVGRSGKIYQRTFWLAGGCLRMNGRFAAAIPLSSMKAIYKDACSTDFAKTVLNKASPSSMLWRSAGAANKAGSPGKAGSPAPNSELCCVLSSQDRVLSLIFHDQR